MSKLRNLLKRLLYPGLDLHTRVRFRRLPRNFVRGPVETLDAGSGNGALAYAAYRLGNKVTAVNYSGAEVERARAFFTGRTDPARLEFRQLNLYDLPALGRQFDQIICSETIEHIRGEREIVGYFAQLLRPGGVLHLCAPYARHPEHALGRFDAPEDGGHVRDGYTVESYRELLEPAGFAIEKVERLGGRSISAADRLLRRVREKAGDAVSLPLFLLLAPLVRLDEEDPNVPFSLYVRARLVAAPALLQAPDTPRNDVVDSHRLGVRNGSPSARMSEP